MKPVGILTLFVGCVFVVGYSIIVAFCQPVGDQRTQALIAGIACAVAATYLFWLYFKKKAAELNQKLPLGERLGGQP